MGSKGIDYTVLTIVIIGAINWGLIGFFGFDLVAFLFGNMTWLSRIVYGPVSYTHLGRTPRLPIAGGRYWPYGHGSDGSCRSPVHIQCRQMCIRDSKEADPGVDLGFAASIQIQLHLDVYKRQVQRRIV